MMSEHISFIKSCSAKSAHTLKNDVSTRKLRRPSYRSRRRSSATQSLEDATPQSEDHSTAEHDGPIVYDLRYEAMEVNGVKTRIHRVFVKARDSDDYCQLGWVLQADIEVCMTCKVRFGSWPNLSKHHCRACGNVVCSACSETLVKVQGLEAIGPVRVCRSCCTDEDEVKFTVNYRRGFSLLHPHNTLLIDFSDVDLHGEDEEEDPNPVNIWSYGPVGEVVIEPKFVIAVRRTDRSQVFVNVCASNAIPYHDRFNDDGNRVIYMICGPAVRTKQNYTIFDVAVNPREFPETLDTVASSALTELCEQVLLAISMLASENDLRIYRVDQPYGTYRHHDQSAVQQALAVEAESATERGTIARPVLAIPAAAAFEELQQWSTTIEDVIEPGSKALLKRTREQTEFAHQHRQMIQERLLARLLQKEEQFHCRKYGDVTGTYTFEKLSVLRGFVIKTREPETGNKTFVNVCFSERIDVLSQMRFDGDDYDDEDPVLAFGRRANVADKAGSECLAYHVVLAKKYETVLTDQASIQTKAVLIEKILDAIGTRYGMTLDTKDFSLPKVKEGFKGDWRPFMICHYKRIKAPAPNRRVTMVNEDSDRASNEEHKEAEDPSPDQLTNTNTDRHSIISDCLSSQASTSILRKSLFETFAKPDYTGQRMLTGEMLQVDDSLHLSTQEQFNLREEAARMPLVLFGWQVQIQGLKGSATGGDVFVITGVRKNHLRKVEFRLSNLQRSDVWVRLYRGMKKPGLVFLPLRRVM